MFRRFTRLLGMAGLLIVSPIVCTTSTQKPKKTRTYIWGHGSYQARPDAIIQFQNFQPKLIKTFTGDKCLKLLRFSQHIQAGIDLNNNLLIWSAKAINANPQTPFSQDTRQNIKILQKDILDVRFTKGFVWAVNTKGELLQWPINKKLRKDGVVEGTSLGGRRLVKGLQGVKEIATGDDHIVVLNQLGEVFAMGDDTLGQCGQGADGRFTYPPFTQRRVLSPVQVQNLPKISKIASGSNHILALDESGRLYGWGSNSNMQLSHQQQFSRIQSPLLCTFTPLPITRNLQHSTPTLLCAGQQFSIITTVNPSSSQVFSFGNNLRGQLALGRILHLKDVSKVQGLSDFRMETEPGQQTMVHVKMMECGRNHCIALMNVGGYVLEWGDNQYGQMGNRKRSMANQPYLMGRFTGKRVVGVFASWNTTGVIVEEEEEGEGK